MAERARLQARGIALTTVSRRSSTAEVAGRIDEHPLAHILVAAALPHSPLPLQKVCGCVASTTARRLRPPWAFLDERPGRPRYVATVHTLRFCRPSFRSGARPVFLSLPTSADAGRYPAPSAASIPPICVEAATRSGRVVPTLTIVKRTHLFDLRAVRLHRLDVLGRTGSRLPAALAVMFLQDALRRQPQFLAPATWSPCSPWAKCVRRRLHLCESSRVRRGSLPSVRRLPASRTVKPRRETPYRVGSQSADAFAG